ncbi:hypothetical protein F5Y12DRAFT_236782 [Xylaria sp. FL1777]|nr:hypothetical protein F5Y12DRAFT_236782 [Xylaria sp. FL1777]
MNPQPLNKVYIYIFSLAKFCNGVFFLLFLLLPSFLISLPFLYALSTFLGGHIYSFLPGRVRRDATVGFSISVVRRWSDSFAQPVCKDAGILINRQPIGSERRIGDAEREAR